MAEFSTLGQNTSIPFTGETVGDNSLGLTNPDSILSGTNRGIQNLGSTNIKTDTSGQRLIVNDNTTNRVAFGRIGTTTTDWGLKVSKPNFNVDTATNDQLIFNSSQNVFKIVTTVKATFDLAGGANGTAGSITIAHNLGYAPLFLGSVTMGTNTVALDSGTVLLLPVLVPAISTIQNSTTRLPTNFFAMAITSVDSINVVLDWSIIFGNLTAAGTIKLYVLQETAT